MLVDSRLIYVYLASVVFFLYPWRFNQHVSKWIFYSVTTLTIHQLKIFSLFLSHRDFLWFLTVSNNYFSLSRTTVRSVDQLCNLQRKTRCGEKKKKKPSILPGLNDHFDHLFNCLVSFCCGSFCCLRFSDLFKGAHLYLWIVISQECLHKQPSCSYCLLSLCFVNDLKQV